MLNFFVLFAKSTVYLEEHFEPGWEKKWSRPEIVRRGVLLGKFRSSAGSYYADEKKQRGLETMDARRFYLFYSNFSQPFDTREKDLIVQYTVRLDMYIDCAGAYIKILGPPNNQIEFSNESDYSIMFGPDICGATLHQTKLRLGYKGDHYDIKTNINANKDHLTHGYTLIIRKNNTIEVRIDNEIKAKGLLSDLFDLPTARSPLWDEKIKRRDILLSKSELSGKEKGELDNLERELSHLSFGDTQDDIKTRKLIYEIADQLGIKANE